MNRWYLAFVVLCLSGLSACTSAPGRDGPALQDPLSVVELIIKCEKRDAQGNCVEKSCSRQRAPNGAADAGGCAMFIAACKKANHESSGDKENARCKKQE